MKICSFSGGAAISVALMSTTLTTNLSAAARGAASVVVPLSPFAGSDDIRATRGSTRPEAMQIDFRLETRTAAGAPRIESGTILLGGDYNAVVSGPSHLIDDFALCRVLSWEDGKSEFASQSCFAGPGFRQMELANRERIGAAVEAAKAAAPAGWTSKAAALEAVAKAREAPHDGWSQRVWAEQELAAQTEISDPLTATMGRNETEWRFGSQLAARISATGFPIGGGERRAMSRYLSRHLSLHPQIREAIVKRGLLPDHIETIVPTPQGLRIQSISFTAPRHAPVDYPLPPHLSAEIVARSHGTSAEARGLHAALLAVAGTAPSGKPSFATLLERMSTAARANRSIDTILAFMAITQQYGGAIPADPTMMAQLRSLAPAFQAQAAAPEGRSFMRASILAGDTQPSPERQSAAAYLAAARELDRLPFGTFRYVTYANLVRTSGDVTSWNHAILASMPTLSDCYWTHIAAYPWASNAFKDLGDSWYGQFKTPKAWEAWDIGRAIDPDWPRSAMQAVNGLEQHLRATMPDNF